MSLVVVGGCWLLLVVVGSGCWLLVVGCGLWVVVVVVVVVVLVLVLVLVVGRLQQSFFMRSTKEALILQPGGR